MATAVVRAEAAEDAAEVHSRVEMDLAIVGDGCAPLRFPLPRIKEDLVPVRYVSHRRMPEQDALPVLRQYVRVLETAVIDELFARRRRHGQELPVPHGDARVNADEVLRLDVVRQGFQSVYRFPIEQMPVRKIGAQPLQHRVVVLSLRHERAVVLQKIVLVIARDAAYARHGKQQLGETDAVPPLVDDVAHHIQLIPAAKAYLVEQPAKEIVIAVDVRNAIYHTKFIAHKKVKFNSLRIGAAKIAARHEEQEDVLQRDNGIERCETNCRRRDS